MSISLRHGLSIDMDRTIDNINASNPKRNLTDEKVSLLSSSVSNYEEAKQETTNGKPSTKDEIEIINILSEKEIHTLCVRKINQAEAAWMKAKEEEAAQIREAQEEEANRIIRKPGHHATPQENDFLLYKIGDDDDEEVIDWM